MFGLKKLEAIENRLQSIENELDIINSYVRKIESLVSTNNSSYEKMKKDFYTKMEEIKKKNDSNS